MTKSSPKGIIPSPCRMWNQFHRCSRLAWPSMFASTGCDLRLNNARMPEGLRNWCAESPLLPIAVLSSRSSNSNEATRSPAAEGFSGYTSPSRGVTLKNHVRIGKRKNKSHHHSPAPDQVPSRWVLDATPLIVVRLLPLEHAKIPSL